MARLSTLFQAQDPFKNSFKGLKKAQSHWEMKEETNSPITPSTSEITLSPRESELSLGSQSSKTRYRSGYSSASVRYVESQVSPIDFEKIRLIGKGDVGRVYLVRKKDNPDELYAMKGFV